ncbi:ABC-type polysaccharide/polyol phosphate export permease/glycosyltransferase involved in cell wall biosynthesis [Bradyrhizobium huanghuaihaiense]|uniref:Glycosyltransferase involved in cell wall biosynthesis n=1 Tax=Bradyrhizobium huanghuaihaiense TaxID=990078 RepID=A0A562R0P1_9BRAD|nr:glycosyltransferase [Bradyrhizobium huanghuaihaiense]TWI62403.1 glycosyltransferase involved in cell wall biosynthesis [Bradyrhizobium huanghuaihaiense]
MHHTSETPRRPSVLHIFKIYYPDLFGGTLTVIRDICASLKDVFASAVLVCSQSAERREIIVNDVPVERVRSFGNVLSLPAAPTYPWRLWRRSAEHDLLALHAPFPLADLVFAFGLGARRPLVVHWHADIVTHAGLRWFIEPLMRRTLRRAKAIIVSDHVLVDNTPLLREFEDKCHVVPFGIDTSGYDWPKIEPHHVNDRGRLVLACGRLVPYKGFDVLIHSAAAHNFETWIIGEGVERPRLEQLIQELGLGDRVRLIGSVNDCERIKLMCLADVFVMPSVTNAETFGLVQLEAMAAGRPIVNTALDTAVPRVARHGIEAITVPPGDAEKLGEAIDTLIRDPERRRRMGLAARSRALSRYSATAFKQGMETIYRNAVAASSEARPATAEPPQATGWLDTVRIAVALAWSDMRHRYVRSLLGPFWMSLQMAIVVVVLGSVIGQMSNANMTARLPMLALSMTAWTFLNGVVLDATTALQNSASLIRDRALPPVIFLLQCTFRHALFALHNACVPLLLWLVFSPHDLSHALAALPGLLLFVACTFALSLVLGAMATRYRDLKPIIESTLMLAFLASPVIWSSDMINHRSTVMRLNPLTHLFAVWREPLAGGHVDPVSIVYVLVALALLVFASVLTLVHLRKAAFWI